MYVVCFDYKIVTSPSHTSGCLAGMGCLSFGDGGQNQVLVDIQNIFVFVV